MTKKTCINYLGPEAFKHFNSTIVYLFGHIYQFFVSRGYNLFSTETSFVELEKLHCYETQVFITFYVKNSHFLKTSNEIVISGYNKKLKI